MLMSSKTSIFLWFVVTIINHKEKITFKLKTLAIFATLWIYITKSHTIYVWFTAKEIVQENLLAFTKPPFFSRSQTTKIV